MSFTTSWSGINQERKLESQLETKTYETAGQVCSETAYISFPCFFFSLRLIIATENTPISLALEEKSLSGTGIFLQINSHITSMLYLSWAEIGTTGAPSAIVPAGKEKKKQPNNILLLSKWARKELNVRETTNYHKTPEKKMAPASKDATNSKFYKIFHNG